MSLCPVLDINDPALRRWQQRRPRPMPEVQDRVREILQEIEQGGEGAVLARVRQLDAPNLENLWVTGEELEAATVDEAQLAAITQMIERVRDFHEVQLGVLTEGWEELNGTYGWRMDACEGAEFTGLVGQRMMPVGRAGVYVPGGKADYPSSVAMNAIPALVAGVQDVILASPPKPDGALNAAMLVTARLLGLRKILKAGGAVAMGALAYGWDGFERVDLVVGPGNAYVNEAKRQLWGAVGVDQYAAASEVCVWALEDAPAEYAAVDWLTQIEHAADNVGVLIATCADHAQEIIEAAENQLAFAERRDSMRAALRDFGVVVVCPDPTQAVTFINGFAPEHLSILGDEASQWIGDIRNAGCIALGLSTPQSAGDYAAGPSHTLPTSGAARFGGPLNVQTFLKFQSLIHLAEEDLEALAPVIETMGQLEGFPAHANGASVRSRRV